MWEGGRGEQDNRVSAHGPWPSEQGHPPQEQTASGLHCKVCEVDAQAQPECYSLRSGTEGVARQADTSCRL